MWNSNLIIFGSFMHLHVYVKRPEAFIGIGRYIKRLIIIIIIIINMTICYTVKLKGGLNIKQIRSG